MRCKKCGRQMNRKKVDEHRYQYVCECGYRVGGHTQSEPIEDKETDGHTPKEG